ncbi:MAG: Fur family transcriptional regulator [Candidatus Melainabacteria bacterium]|nr:Fur family transcriptional regulator [Candidatus Melainabacteria bacterium]
MTKTRDELLADLRAKGFRLTPQREKIVDIFCQIPAGEHISAEDLYRLLRSENADISLATSYRTLKLLANTGLLRELDFAEDHKHYELVRDDEAPHHHIICTRCSATEEFDLPEAFHLVAHMAHERHYDLHDVQIKVFGICRRDPCPNDPTGKGPQSSTMRAGTLSGSERSANERSA